MRPPLLLRVATRMLAWLLPKELRESLLGDLAEEYARRGVAGSYAALQWYLRQLCSSVPHLLWLKLTRAVWLSTVAVAVLAFFAFGEMQIVIRWAISGSSGAMHNVLDLLLLFPAAVVIGYLAERLRRRSAIVLGVAVLATVIAMHIAETGSPPPQWYRIAWYLLGPAACLGGVLNSRQSSRRASR